MEPWEGVWVVNPSAHTVLRYLRHTLDAERLDGVADARLLERFVGNQDEAAFELLVWRHGGMVLKVCRQVLGDEHAAEDAFQAVFLTLIRKAGSIRRRETLGGWLYHVATHAALRLRREQLRRREHPFDLETVSATVPEDRTELQQLLHEEINRLPAKYRTPIVLCYFESKTHDEAAEQLCWPKGTVAGRLARARALLQKRLQRRGIALATVLPMAQVGSHLPPAALVLATMQVAKSSFGGQTLIASLVSARALQLTEGVIQTMWWSKMKVGAALCAAVSLLALGATAIRGGLWAGPDHRAVTEQAANGSDEPRAASNVVDEPNLNRADSKEMDRRIEAQTINNLKMLGLAMHNYHDVNGRFPAPAVYDKNGKALLSWRVLLLPYLEQDHLYRRFKLDEPWDGPHNRQLLAQMPKVFAPVGTGQHLANSTYYQIFVDTQPARTSATNSTAAGIGTSGKGSGVASSTAGPWTAHAGFQKGQGASISDITDGTSNTLMIVEAASPVPWTKPEDLHYAADEPLPELGGLFPAVFHAAFFDGSVQTLLKTADRQLLRALITRDGGEVVDLSKLRIPTPRAEDSGHPLSKERLQQQNRDLAELLRRSTEELDLLRTEASLLRRQREEQAARSNPEIKKLLEEQAVLSQSLQRVRKEMEQLKKDVSELKQQGKHPTARPGSPLSR